MENAKRKKSFSSKDSKAIQKIHDLKKASVGKFHRGIRRYYSKYRYNGLFYLIALMQNIAVLFLSAAALFRSLSLSPFS